MHPRYFSPFYPHEFMYIFPPSLKNNKIHKRKQKQIKMQKTLQKHRNRKVNINNKIPIRIPPKAKTKQNEIKSLQK